MNRYRKLLEESRLADEEARQAEVEDRWKLYVRLAITAGGFASWLCWLLG